jgi:glycine cleavage system transcriptional repressor
MDWFRGEPALEVGNASPGQEFVVGPKVIYDIVRGVVNYYLLSASGADRPGIVAALTDALFRSGCNLEDSSMLRLGSEFGVLLIFTSPNRISPAAQRKLFRAAERRFGLAVAVKAITAAQARFKRIDNSLYMIRVFGPDQPGIVSQVTNALSRRRFNITDLSTHRTSQRRSGYILLIEGVPRTRGDINRLESDLAKLKTELGVRVTIEPIDTTSL